MSLPSWEEAASNDVLGKWAMNLMLINVSTRQYGRAVRLPEGGIGAPSGSGVSKSAVSRRFVALSAARMKEWMAADSVQAGPSGHPDRRHSHQGRPDAAGRCWR